MPLLVLNVINKPKELIEYKETLEGPDNLKFWNSLFAWMALLAAFKYWLSTRQECNENPSPIVGKPKRVLINNRVYDLNSVKVLGDTLLIEGHVLTRKDVNLAGFIFEINGELYLDLSQGKGFSTIESLTDKIIVSRE